MCITNPSYALQPLVDTMMGGRDRHLANAKQFLHMHASMVISVVEGLATEDIQTIVPLFCLGEGTFAIQNATYSN